MSNPTKPTPVVPATIAKLLDALPGLVGGIDRALFDVTGGSVPFILVVFADGAAAHATNIVPAACAMAALKDLANNYAEDNGESGDAAG